MWERVVCVGIVGLLLVAAAPLGNAEPDNVPDNVAFLSYGTAGLPTATPYEDDEFQWLDIASFEMAPGYDRTFFVLSDFWLGVGVRAVDFCLRAPSGDCLVPDDKNPEFGLPCVSFRLECQSLAEGSNIGLAEPGEWTLSARGWSNERHEFHVFAWAFE